VGCRDYNSQQHVDIDIRGKGGFWRDSELRDIELALRRWPIALKFWQKVGGTNDRCTQEFLGELDKKKAAELSLELERQAPQIESQIDSMLQPELTRRIPDLRYKYSEGYHPGGRTQCAPKPHPNYQQPALVGASGCLFLGLEPPNAGFTVQ